MRAIWLALAVLLAACSGSPPRASSSTGPGPSAGGTTLSGATGSAGGSSGTTGGTEGGSASGSGSGTGAAPGTSCARDSDCASAACGIDGRGVCCAKPCAVDDAGACGAFGCDDAGACLYADAATPCGPSFSSCTGIHQSGPSTCDGAGRCPGASVGCAPYTCGEAACLSSCEGQAQCAPGYPCDPDYGSCCDGPRPGGQIRVDAFAGDDARACCGVGANAPCQTLARAMALIDLAAATGVIIEATVGDAGGDWNAPEVFPVVLGRGAELYAPGVSFRASRVSAIFQIDRVSPGDDAGYASLAGSADRPVVVGLDPIRDSSGSGAASAIEVASGSVLYIANAFVNSSASISSAAISVAGGLVLAQDHGGDILGTVQIGTADADAGGWIGIDCLVPNGAGTSVTDAALDGGSSVVFERQRSVDLSAAGSAYVSLSSAPVFGLAPIGTGFGTCPAKLDGQAVSVTGAARVTLRDATIQCIAGDGLVLVAGDGYPSLTLQASTVQNVAGSAIHSSYGTARVFGSTLRFNHFGAWQDSLGLIDLSGELDGGVSPYRGNTVVCSSAVESDGNLGSVPGVCVINNSASVLNADNVAWDTPRPDLFNCAGEGPFPCPAPACVGGPCQIPAGQDGMDALFSSTGQITTFENLLWDGGCSP